MNNVLFLLVSSYLAISCAPKKAKDMRTITAPTKEYTEKKSQPNIDDRKDDVALALIGLSNQYVDLSGNSEPTLIDDGVENISKMDKTEVQEILESDKMAELESELGGRFAGSNGLSLTDEDGENKKGKLTPFGIAFVVIGALGLAGSTRAFIENITAVTVDIDNEMRKNFELDDTVKSKYKNWDSFKKTDIYKSKRKKLIHYKKNVEFKGTKIVGGLSAAIGAAYIGAIIYGSNQREMNLTNSIEDRKALIIGEMDRMIKIYKSL